VYGTDNRVKEGQGVQYKPERSFSWFSIHQSQCKKNGKRAPQEEVAMTDTPAANLMGAVGTAASIGVGLVATGMVVKQVDNLSRTTRPRKASTRKRKKRK